MLSEVLARRANSNQWEFHCRRSLFDWEVPSWEELMVVLDNNGVVREGQPDMLI